MSAILRRVIGATAVVTILPWVVASALAQRAPVETVQFYAESVGRVMKYNIILPPDRDAPANADRLYPTLYLLHGGGNNFQGWTRFLGVSSYALNYEMIVVMPDVGNSSYVNWVQTDDDRKNAWEDHIVEDVMGHVEANYPALRARAARAIAGYSMGGFGALSIALRHPQLFISAGSHSGSIASARTAAERLRAGGLARPPREYSPADQARRRIDNPQIGLPGFSSPVDRTPQGQPYVTPEQADAHDPFKLVLQLAPDELPYIHIDCGIDDRLIASAKEFANLLLEHGIPFDYMQLSGGHDPAYWIEAVGYYMGLHYEVMQRALGQRPLAVRRAAPSR